MRWKKRAEIWRGNFRVPWKVLTHQRGVRRVELQAGRGFPEGLAQKDQPIFQAALACQATHLLTGDLQDFGSFMNQPENTFGICIQTVAEFLNHLG
jgi:hypothetical protein